MNLTQKETTLLNDLKTQEQLCVQKYTESSAKANDAQLKNLFTQLSQVEQSHLTMIQDLQSGKMPQTPSGSGNMPTFTQTYTTQETPEKKNDCFLCNDVLTTEKHVSGLYDTCIFEFADENCRNLLNTIQKQEQQHGKMIYDYMSVNNMY